jgi:ethanolamine utilization protein EutA
MSHFLHLVGLDFGTTTSSAVIATARLAKNSVTGRTELADVAETFRPEAVFTPLREERLDEQAIGNLLDAWLAAGGVRPEQVFGGGALLTGLTAQQDNAAALVRLVRRRLGDTLIASADDPCLESWLAFMGSCASLSRAHPEQPFLNLDIGGGTTNLALGQAGEVLRTGCLFVGARHIQVVPGSYQIVRVSPYARAALNHLGIHKGPGDCLSRSDVDAVLTFYLDLIEAATTGNSGVFQNPVARLHQQVAFGESSRHAPRDASITRSGCELFVVGSLRDPFSGHGVTGPHGRITRSVMATIAITFSGGVGELIYAHVQGKPWPPTTHYGDLGIDLAQRIVMTPFWAAHLKQWQPASGGRATVYGLLRHCTEVSGSTLFLPSAAALPLANVPILGSVGPTTGDDHVRQLIELARRSPCGGCLQLEVGSHDAPAISAIGKKIAALLREAAFPPTRPLVLLVSQNIGKVLGHYVTQWGALPLNLVVIDEVAPRDAQYVQIGSPRGQVVPVSFYGINPEH